MSERETRDAIGVHTSRSLSESGERGRSSISESPIRKDKGKLKKLKSRPQMRRHTSSVTSKLKFSVDDDVNDDPNEDTSGEPYDNLERKYIDGYHDALRDLYQRKRAKLIDSNVQPEAGDLHPVTPKKFIEPDEAFDESAEIEIRDGEDDQSMLGDLDGNTNNQEDDANSQHTTCSSETVESLNLKDRQNAINATHPFGIKIWKPSIYKKNRSVAVRAEEDIHEYKACRPTGPIFIGVYLTNFIWSCTVGLLLYVVCVMGAIVVFVFSGFALNRSSRRYAHLFLKLGRYWFNPFGKFVLLNKDENYINEDELDGRSISEFHRWRLEDEGRLFFAPPRRMTNSESRPLLKDHKGRPLRDAYESATSASGNGENAVDENLGTNENNDEFEGNDVKVRFFGRGNWSSGRLIFYLFFYGILQPVCFITAAICWLLVFTIPMFNLNQILCEHVRRRPLALHFEKEKDYYKRIANTENRENIKGQSIILCTYRCCGLHYYKYTLDGTNIIFFNLLSVVAFIILDYYTLSETLHWKTWYTDSSFIFCGCLLSIIPLAYFIGQAVASISAQSSMGVGAVINAFFSTVVEIFLYCVALNQSKGKLVEGSMIGSILGGVLLLPGLSMCGGALNRKTQRYNPRSAGVSSTMLLFAMVTMFAPSLFYQLYGSYEIRCQGCENGPIENCTTCSFIQPSLNLDALYYKVLRPFALFVALALFLAYVCGLYFTLKTHASLIWATSSHEQALHHSKKDTGLRSPSIVSLDNSAPKKIQTPNTRGILTNSVPVSSRSTAMSPLNECTQKQKLENTKHTLIENFENQNLEIESDESEGGHDAPNWSTKKSSVILLGATVLYAIIAEILVDNVDAVLSHFPINPKFLGLTVFALVPNTTEFVNAISFAVGGNVALSMEIGSAYALQVVLIQIPSLVVYSVYKQFTNVDMIFSLIFPRWDVVASLVSIYLFTYVYAEGKSNYFKGAILILIYIVVLAGFYLDDVVAALGDDAANAAIKPPLLLRS